MQSYNINCCDNRALYKFLSTKIEELFGTDFKDVWCTKNDISMYLLLLKMIVVKETFSEL
jgi:hypothetical protein